jgi:chromosome segregation ATPase
MSDFKEEAYVLEKMEISEDDDEGFEYKEIKDSEGEIEDPVIESIALEDDDDLNDFEALKTKTELKRLEATKAKGGVVIEDQLPKTLEREVVIDDFIRNFMQKFSMSKTINVFQ